jgi:hypothetical protein
VAAFYLLFDQQDTFSFACDTFQSIGAAGFRRLLDVGVLDYLLPRLAPASDASFEQSPALGLLQQIGQSHAALLASGDILTKLGQLVRRHHDDFRRAKACAVLAVVLRASTFAEAEVDSAVQDGLIPVLVRFAGSEHHEDVAVRVLMLICLRGTDAHRRALVEGNVLPLLARVVQRRMPRSAASRPDQRALDEIHALYLQLDQLRALRRELGLDVGDALPPSGSWLADAAQNNTFSSAAKKPEKQDRREVDALLDQLRALALLLRTATMMDAEAAVATPPATAAAVRKAQCISRAEFELLLEHWHPEVRAAVDELLSEHFA